MGAQYYYASIDFPGKPDFVSRRDLATDSDKIEFKHISCGFDYTLGVAKVGTGFSWGLPISSREKIAVPQGYIWKMLEAGYSHSCGVTKFNRNICWGRDAE